MLVVPEPSERCTTVMPVAGSLTPGLSAAICGSFQVLIEPAKMLATTGPESFRARTQTAHVVGHSDRTGDGRDLHDLAGHGAQIRVGKRRVRTGEIDRVGLELFDARDAPKPTP